jgi:ketosteroid isomerase-like protein
LVNPALGDIEAIQIAVRAINDHWRNKEYDRIGAVLADEAVIAPPGFDRRVRGRDAYIQSYRDYDEAARTLKFWAGDAEIDVVGDVAVAVVPFEVVYEIRGARHRERGHDILVFSRTAGEWRVVWRTMQYEPMEEETG